jgi:hypothetical protein
MVALSRTAHQGNPAPSPFSLSKPLVEHLRLVEQVPTTHDVLDDLFASQCQFNGDWATPPIQRWLQNTFGLPVPAKTVFAMDDTSIFASSTAGQSIFIPQPPAAQVTAAESPVATSAEPSGNTAFKVSLVTSPYSYMAQHQ